MWREATIGQKIGASALFGNLVLVSGMVVRREQYLEEEGAAKRRWETSKDNKFECFYTAKRYYEQCSLDIDDGSIDDCLLLATGLDSCKQKLEFKLPDTTPAMRRLPIAFTN